MSRVLGLRLPSPRRLPFGVCASGDRCAHPSVDGTRFCAHHLAELRRIARALREGQ